MNIDANALARTINLALALINQILTVAGYPVLPFQDEQITMIVATAWTLISSGIAWWKNNSFTQAAKAGDKVKKAVKAGDISAGAVDNMLK